MSLKVCFRGKLKTVREDGLLPEKWRGLHAPSLRHYDVPSQKHTEPRQRAARVRSVHVERRSFEAARPGLFLRKVTTAPDQAKQKMRARRKTCPGSWCSVASCVFSLALTMNAEVRQIPSSP